MGQKCSHVCGFHRRQGSQQFTLEADDHATPKKQRRETETQIVTTNDTDEDSVVETEYPASPFPDDEHPRGLRVEFRPARKLHWTRPPSPLCQLIAACKANETDRACELLQSPVDVNYYRSPEENPLILAIRQKNIEIVAALIDAGADLNPSCFHNAAAFHPVLEAVRVGDVDVLKCIHRAGGDLTVTAVSTTQNGKTVVELLNPRNEDLRDYLHTNYELEVGSVRYTQKEILALYRRKDEAGLRRKLTYWPYAHITLGNLKLTPWMITCKMGWIDIMRRYYAAHRDVDRQDEVRITQFGMTGLMYATLASKADACRLLLQWGARTFIRNKWGKTALHFAVETGDASVLEALGAEGLNRRTKVPTSQMGETCYDVASHAAKALSMS